MVLTRLIELLGFVGETRKRKKKKIKVKGKWKKVKV